MWFDQSPLLDHTITVLSGAARQRSATDVVDVFIEGTSKRQRGNTNVLILARDRSSVQGLAVAKDCPRLATAHARHRPVSTEGRNLTPVSQQSAVWTLAKTLEDFGTVHGRQDSATDQRMTHSKANREQDVLASI